MTAGLLKFSIYVGFSASLLSACGSDDGTSIPDTGSGLNEKSCSLQYVSNLPAAASGLDPLFASQWHLSNTGQSGGIAGNDLNVNSIWLSTRGENVRIAVVDDAIEVTHEDLFPNIVPNKSYNYRPDRLGSAFPLPCSSGDNHGTAVAGLIVARNNNALGVVGVAPQAQLVGYNALSTSLDSDIADALNRDINDNHIFHNSWGAPDNGKLNPSDSSFHAAIETGIEQGRDQKGAIFVFPAGNGGCYAVSQSTSQCISENSNFDGYVNRRGIIAVCAVDHDGKQPFYGEPGANVLVCGYSSNSSSSISTIGIQNTYRSDFSGTSASAPMVSGVVALMLSANPSLSWRDVPIILARSARKNDAGDAGWSSHFGLDFNPKYGFGVADAQAAVTMATGFSSVGDASTQLKCGPFTSTPNVALPDPSPGLSTQTDSITIDDCAISDIEFVQIHFTASHSYSGDLKVDLSSPNGLVSPLANQRLCVATSGQSDACGTYNAWPFGVVRHMDEAVNGTWSLSVTDEQTNDTGTFNQWSITFYGR